MHVDSAKSALLELKAYREPTGLDGPILARNLDARSAERQNRHEAQWNNSLRFHRQRRYRNLFAVVAGEPPAGGIFDARSDIAA